MVERNENRRIKQISTEKERIALQKAWKKEYKPTRPNQTKKELVRKIEHNRIKQSSIKNSMKEDHITYGIKQAREGQRKARK